MGSGRWGGEVVWEGLCGVVERCCGVVCKGRLRGGAPVATVQPVRLLLLLE